MPSYNTSPYEGMTVLSRHQADLLNAPTSSSMIGRQDAHRAPYDARD